MPKKTSLNDICGIYSITNIKNKKRYIGQSVHIYQRLCTHSYKLKRNINNNIHLQSAWNKYGENSFYFEILEECDERDLDEREVYYISFFKSSYGVYNQTLGGEGVRGHSPKSSEKWLEATKKDKENRRNIQGVCIICNEKTKNLYSKYCEKHKGRCHKCGDRMPKNEGVICEKCRGEEYNKKCCICGSEFVKRSSTHRMCSKCSKEANRTQKRELMRKRRNAEKSIIQ